MLIQNKNLNKNIIIILTTIFPTIQCNGCTKDSTEGHEGIGNAKMIAASLGGALGLAFVIITIFIICRRKASNQRISSNGSQ